MYTISYPAADGELISAEDAAKYAANQRKKRQSREVARGVTPVRPRKSRNPVPHIARESGTIRVIRFADYLEPPPRKFVVDGLIPENFITSLYGDGGTGKSYLALFLGFCVARGEPFAGRNVESGNVLYVDAELDAEEQGRRVYAVARGLGLERPPEGFYYCRPSDSLNDPNTIRALSRIKDEQGIVLVIVDSLTLGAFGLDPNQAQDVIRLLKSFEPLGTILAIDHVRKPQQGENPHEFRAFGSVFKHNLGRSQIHLIARANGVLELSHAKANFTAKQPPIYTTLDFSKDESGREVVRIETVEQGELVAANQRTIEKVFQAVAKLNNGATLEQLQKELPNIKRKTIQNQLSELRKAGRVKTLERGIWGVTKPEQTARVNGAPDDAGQVPESLN